MAGHVLFSSSSVREARKLQRQYDVVRGQELARTLKHASTQARTRTHAHTHTHTTASTYRYILRSARSFAEGLVYPFGVCTASATKGAPIREEHTNCICNSEFFWPL